MKLYGMPGSCSLGTHIALEWSGAPYEYVRLNHADLKTPHQLAINPSGAVPVLQEDDGWTLTEAGAIHRYIATLVPGARLGPDPGPRQEAEFLSWLSLLSSDVHKAFSPIWSPRLFHPDPAQHDALKQAARDRVQRLMLRLDEKLGDRAHPVANRRTVVDAHLFVFLRWTDKIGGGLQSFPALQRFYRDMTADPAVKRALAREGLVAPSKAAA